MRALRSFVAVVAIAGILVGCGAGSSPQGTFEKMKTAVKGGGGMGGTLKYMTPESQNAIVGGMGFGVAMGASLGKKFGKADADAEAICKKHGIDLEKLPQITGKEDMTQLSIDFGAGIKDKPGFIKDLEELNKKKGKNSVDLTAKMGEATLKDVKVTGNTAAGKVVTKSDGKETTQPIYFKQVNGEWLIDIIPTLRKNTKVGK